MAEQTRKVFLTFPKKIIDEPIIYNLGHRFKVITNIRGASVDDVIGVVALELVGDDEEVEKALEYLREREVRVEPMDGDD